MTSFTVENYAQGSQGKGLR